jgi:type IV pilus assembly protein PilV
MEVMAALAVLAVGATGVVGLQKITIIGNRNARTLSTANALATTWIERLRSDGARWNVTNGVTNTTWLNHANGGWFVPTEGEGTLLGSHQADVLGADIFPNTGDTSAIAFCTHVRLEWMGPAATASLMRAEVRVFWSRNGNPVSDTDCDNPALAFPDPRFGYAVFSTGIALR